MKERKGNKKFILVLLLLLVMGVSVGYAALSTTLNINGTSTIKKQTWDVHFENVQVAANSATATQAPEISTDETTVTYSVNLSNPGDFYEFTVDVVNKGSIPVKLSADAVLSGIDAAKDVFTNYTVTYSDGTAIKAGDKLAATTGKKTVKVRVEYDANIDNDQLPTADTALDLKFSMNYVQDK